MYLAAFAEAEGNTGDVHFARQAHFAAQTLWQVAEPDIADAFAQLACSIRNRIACHAVGVARRVLQQVQEQKAGT